MFWEMRWREFSGGYFVEKVWNTEAILDDTCRKSLWALPKKAKKNLQQQMAPNLQLTLTQLAFCKTFLLSKYQVEIKKGKFEVK